MAAAINKKFVMMHCLIIDFSERLQRYNIDRCYRLLPFIERNRNND